MATKSHTAPFRLLISLLYGNHAWLLREPGLVVTFQVSSLSRFLRIQHKDVYKYLNWLIEANLVGKVDYPGRGTTRIVLLPPVGCAIPPPPEDAL